MNQLSRIVLISVITLLNCNLSFAKYSQRTDLFSCRFDTQTMKLAEAYYFKVKYLVKSLDLQLFNFIEEGGQSGSSLELAPDTAQVISGQKFTMLNNMKFTKACTVTADTIECEKDANEKLTILKDSQGYTITTTDKSGNIALEFYLEAEHCIFDPSKSFCQDCDQKKEVVLASFVQPESGCQGPPLLKLAQKDKLTDFGNLNPLELFVMFPKDKCPNHSDVSSYLTDIKNPYYFMFSGTTKIDDNFLNSSLGKSFISSFSQEISYDIDGDGKKDTMRTRVLSKHPKFNNKVGWDVYLIRK